jgi:hypothetical protein
MLTNAHLSVSIASLPAALEHRASTFSMGSIVALYVTVGFEQKETRLYRKGRAG